MIPQNIATSYEVDIFIKVLIGTSKNSVTCRTIKNLVDNFKAAKVEKYNQDHPKESETISKSIDPDCNSKCSKSTNAYLVKSSSSIDIKVVEKNTRLFSFSKSYFVEKEGEKNSFLEQ